MWNDSHDTLLELFDNDPSIFIECFADDCALIITGPDIVEMRNKMQGALKKCEAWGVRQGLTFAPGKSEAVVFTRKQTKDILMPRRMKLSGSFVNYVEVARYLGVWLDKKLNFRAHLDIKVKKVITLLNLLNAVMGKFWGISPVMAAWAWRGVVRPTLTFGNLVWGHVLDAQWAKDKLAPVQLKAFRMMTFFRKSTPCLGLEMITNTWPLDLHVKYLQVASWYRTKGFESIPENDLYTNKVTLIGHRQRIEEWLYRNNCGSHTVINSLLDQSPEKYMWEKDYVVSTRSMNPNQKSAYGLPWLKSNINDLEIYTDGSKDMESGMTGGSCAPYVRTAEGLVPAMNGGNSWNAFHLGKMVSPFQAELYSIFRAAVWIHTFAVRPNSQCRSIVPHVKQNIYLYSDCQSALKALMRNTNRSELVDKTYNALNRAAKATGSTLTLSWVRGHSNILGNEKADQLAKLGRDDTTYAVPDTPKPTLAYVKSLARAAVVNAWNLRWAEMPDNVCWQTKFWFQTVKPQFSAQALLLKRRPLSKLIMILTGHTFWKYHEYKISLGLLKQGKITLGEVVSPVCNWCQTFTADYDPDLPDGRHLQTAIHVITECDRYAADRLAVFGTLEPQISLLTPSKILRFIHDANIEVYPNEHAELAENQRAARTQ